MQIISRQTPVAPLNGLVVLYSQYGEYATESAVLDYETHYHEDNMVVFKCYDTAGNVVLVKIHSSVVETAVFGDMRLENQK